MAILRINLLAHSRCSIRLIPYLQIVLPGERNVIHLFHNNIESFSF